ncbi:uncharacterized protein BROUX77_003467 [Berkeleyomyces rouxiae]|uniref:uncharacterized protein n=1 Tax=Berkeleyomyces rouxiae TaxID=2035830 RepID=UPI003B7E7D28
MVDSGSTTCFVDSEFIARHQIPTVLKARAESLHVVDGSETAAGKVTHQVPLSLSFPNYSETLVFQITKLGGYHIILGKCWLDAHNPEISWPSNTLKISVTSTADGNAVAASDSSSSSSSVSTASTDSGASFDFSYTKNDKNIASTAGSQIEGSAPASATSPLPSFIAQSSAVSCSCVTVSSQALHRFAKAEKLQIYRVTAQEVLDYLNQEDLTPEQEHARLLERIPKKYHDLLPLFSREGADQLPPHRDIDHAINFVPDAKYPKAPLYDMTPLELQAVKKYLDGMLAKGFISSSSSPLASPILFARKPGSLRFCVDFRAVNDITIKDVTPLPRINESLRTAATGNIFTKLDLRAAYHLIRIKKGDEYKTAFRTRYGIFEYNVMPFGLTNAPATCQKYVSEVLSEYLDIFCVCYLDDILVFSLNQEEHDVHVRKVLLKLAQASLFVKGEKCEFDKTETTFVGFVISADALKMDPAKVAAVREWEAPRTVKGVQSFLGFANFYRRFIRDFSRICTPLFELTKKTQSFVWSSECEAAFHTLKDLFCSEPILKHFDYLLDTVIETDASDRVISAVMSQYHPTDKGLLLHPVAYFSQKMNPAQCNYGVGDKELLAIVESLKSWRFMVESLEKPVLVLTDHRNLAVLKQIPAMNRRQARWAMELSEYRYVITYRPGSLNSRADALTRRYEDLVSSSSEEDKELCAPIIPPENFIGTMSLVDEVKIALSTDKWALDVISALRGQSTKPPDVDLSVCRLDNDGLLFVNDLLYLPNEDLRVRALKNCHDIMPSGHPGQKNTFELLVREYWWPGMRRDVIRYIRNCEVCQRIKSARHSPYGLLKPLTIPQARWTSVSLDFITGLPVSNSFDMILVVVDRLSKMAHFIPCDSSLDAAGFAKLYLSAVYRLHGLPLDIVSDRGSLFTSAFSKALAKLLGIKQNLSTAFHPQTDGQTERVNSILEQYLRGYTNYRQDNWADLLPLAEFSYNDSESSSTMLTPFFANHGFHPRSGRESLPVSVEKGPLRNFVKELDNICQFLKTEITWSRERMTEYANRHKSSAPLLREGDLVWLLSRNIRTTRPSKKLDFKKLGPFKILRKVSSHAYELALPATMKVHPVFHVCLLEPCASDPLPGQKNPPPPPVIVDGEEEFVVKEIIGVSSRGPLQYQFHPETDGAQERSNQEIETYLRAFTVFLQDDWAALLPQAQVALNNRTATATGLSPFFFTHGYNIDPLDMTTDHEPGSTVSPATAGHNWLAKHRDATAFAQASMAFALETQERHANRGRQAAEAFKVGDRVYLRLRNVRTIRPSKTLDWLALPYRVIQVVGTHAVKLDTPTGIHPVFHVSLVRRARDDPLPSQVLANPEPPAIAPEEASGDLVAGEYLVDEILQHKVVDKRHKVLVQWTGWAEPTWEPLSHVLDTAALERYEQTHECPWNIASDRQFANMFWKRLCTTLKIDRRLSTAYHPQTNGATERTNAEVKTKMAKLLHDRSDWLDCLPIVEFALNAAPAASTETSPFTLSHGYSPDLVELQPDAIAPLAAPVAANTSPIAQATRILKSLADHTDWAKASLSAAKSAMEEQSNRHRQPHRRFQPGDWVWLAKSSHTVQQEGPGKRLRPRYQKLQVLEAVGSHSYRLDLKGARGHDVFHADRLKYHPNDPWPSQDPHVSSPGPVEIDGFEEYEVEKILEHRPATRDEPAQYLVKWVGWRDPTWEPTEALEETAALEEFLRAQETADVEV